MKMNTTQKDAWNVLKLAADKYSQTTGSEVVVATTFFPVYAENDIYLSQDDKKLKTAFHGHGNLLHRVKRNFDQSDQDSNETSNNSWNSDSVEYEQGGRNIINNRPVSSSPTDPSVKSLSTSFRTLKLDMRPTQSHLHSGASGSLYSTSKRTDSNAANNRSNSGQLKRSERKKGKRKKQQANLGELELDENFMFNEAANEDESDEDESDDSGESEDSSPGNLPHFRSYNMPPGDQNRPGVHRNRNQFATSLPVGIDLQWGNRNDGGSRFRDNQGPHPPFRYQPVTISKPTPTVLKAENNPQFDTMMASMQALARSVTDDSAMIFGERPRPRINVEHRN